MQAQVSTRAWQQSSTLHVRRWPRDRRQTRLPLIPPALSYKEMRLRRSILNDIDMEAFRHVSAWQQLEGSTLKRLVS